MNTFEDRRQRRYDRWVEGRDRMLLPLMRVLSTLRVGPTMLSHVGVLLVGLFVFFITRNPNIAALCLVLGSLVDLIDGPLSRYQNLSSNEGKLTDIICDNLRFALFVIGIVHARLTSGLVGLILVYLVALSFCLRTTNRVAELQPGEEFRLTGGFLILPNLMIGLSYATFLVFVFLDRNYLSALSLACSVILLLDCLFSYTKLVRRAGKV